MAACHQSRREKYHEAFLVVAVGHRRLYDHRGDRSIRWRVHAYVEHILAPSLTAGQIVVLDNLSAHKGARVRQLIEERGCELLFLLAYSPDYSPIEETFSQVKTFLHKVGARTHEALQDAIGQALETVTAADALGWFTHCGYVAA